MDYGIYVARVVGNASQSDLRLRVRVLPHMEGIPLQDLPLWPPFYQGRALTGSSHSGREDGDLVWVIANNEFTTGYVLGAMNSYTHGSSYKESSIPKELYTAAENAFLRINGQVVSLTNIEVTFWNGNSIHLVDRANGSHFIVFANGTIHCVQDSQIAFKVGDNIFNMNQDEIQMTAKVIRLDGAVRLGSIIKGKVMVTTGSDAKNSVPAEDVWA